MLDKKVVYASILVIYVLGLFYLAVTPNVPRGFPKYTDKAVHFAEFLILTFMVFKTAEIFHFKTSTLLWVALFFIALTSEFVQLSVEGRVFSVFDLLANMIGVLAGYGLWRFIKHYY